MYVCHSQTENGPCLNDLKHMDIKVCHLGWVHLHFAGYDLLDRGKVACKEQRVFYLAH